MATIAETPETSEEVRLRLLDYQRATGMTWAKIALISGVKSGTLTPWKDNNYQGNVMNIASQVRRFLDGEASKAEMRRGIIADPGYVETPTSQQITNLLRYATMGEIVAIAASPGVGKTKAAVEFAASGNSNVFIATMRPSTTGVQPMQMAVLAALGIHDQKGSPQQLTAAIMKHVAGKAALLIVDEAQECGEKALDEMRSWHDACGLGIALMGDERVLARLGGKRRQELARLHSRISMRLVLSRPSSVDAETVARAWGVEAPDQLKFLRSLAGKPGALRGIAKVVKLAGMHAHHAARPLDLTDLHAAWDQLNSDIVPTIS